MIPTREEIDVSNGTLCAMRDEIPAALKPSEDREAKIEAWEKEALTVESDEGSFGQGYFILRRSEITEAVSLMRSAGDGKALLRELRAWIIDEKWCAPGIVRKIDEMLAQPAPVEQPAAAVPEKLICDRNGCGKERPPYAWMSSSKGERKYCCFKCMEDDRSDFLQGGAAPVEQPAAAVPDDTRELVAQLAEAVSGLHWLDHKKLAEVAGIVSRKLRGGA